MNNSSPDSVYDHIQTSPDVCPGEPRLNSALRRRAEVESVGRMIDAQRKYKVEL